MKPASGSAARRSRAFAPAHVTGLFVPAASTRDPRSRGSVGAGIVLEAGVSAEAEWRPGPRRRVSVTSDLGHPLSISEEVANRLLGPRDGTLSVRLAHALPVGQGFGTSAAGAVATALAVARATGRTRAEAVAVAHLADLFGGGGLGGVAAILGGGLEVRVRPGIPPFGRVIHRPYPGRVFVGVVGGPMPTASVLGNRSALARVLGAADRLGPLVRHPDAERLWDASEAFTDRVGLAPRPVSDLLRGLRRRGARAAQAMFGRSFFASLPADRRRDDVLRWLRDRSVRAVELAPDTRGARSLPSPRATVDRGRATASAARAASVFSRAQSRRLP